MSARGDRKTGVQASFCHRRTTRDGREGVPRGLQAASPLATPHRSVKSIHLERKGKMSMLLRTVRWVGIGLVTTVLLAGCGGESSTRKVSGSVPEELRSGFLADYSRVQPVAGEPAVMRWINQDIDWNKYQAFMIEPVDSMIPPAYRSEVQPDPKVVAAVTRYFREALAREIGAKFKVVDEPGLGVARVSVAVTSIVPTTKQLSAWQYLPIGLVAVGVGELAGKRDKEIVVFMEGEMTDSLNGELLLEVMQGRVSKEGGIRNIDEITPETVKPVLDYWAAEQRDLILDAQTGKQ